MGLPTTDADLLAKIRQIACPHMTEVSLVKGDSVQVRRRGDSPERGRLFKLVGGKLYSQTCKEHHRVWSEEELTTLIYMVADGR